MSVQWGYYFAWVSLTEAETTNWLAFRYITAFSWRRARFRQMVVVRFLIEEFWQEMRRMGSMGGFSCENPLGSRWKLVTPQIRNTSDVCFLTLYSDCPISTKKTPQHGVWEVFDHVIFEGYPSIPSDEHVSWGLNSITESGVDKNLRIHDLRHTFASRLVSKGVPIFDVSKLLGLHPDIR